MLKDPKLLERRMKVGPAAETRIAQKIVVVLAFIFFASLVVVPALDHRFGWSRTPTSVVILGNVLVVLSYVGFYRVFRENTYGAATIRVDEEQQVISTGPYAIVRHPRYSAGLLMSVGVPLALGSWLGLIALPPGFLVLAWRLLDEETFLRRNLPGYTEYTRTVRWRLIPACSERGGATFAPLNCGGLQGSLSIRHPRALSLQLSSSCGFPKSVDVA